MFHVPLLLEALFKWVSRESCQLSKFVPSLNGLDCSTFYCDRCALAKSRYRRVQICACKNICELSNICRPPSVARTLRQKLIFAKSNTRSRPTWCSSKSYPSLISYCRLTQTRTGTHSLGGNSASVTLWAVIANCGHCTITTATAQFTFIRRYLQVCPLLCVLSHNWPNLSCP